MIEVPVFGREEDAADQMAVFPALQFSKDVARTITRGRAYFWAVLNDPKEWAGFADEHGTSSQRFYNTMCLAYGGDPQTFKEFVDKGWLLKGRAANCEAEYVQGEERLPEDHLSVHRPGRDEEGAGQGLDEIDVRRSLASGSIPTFAFHFRTHPCACGKTRTTRKAAILTGRGWM